MKKEKNAIAFEMEWMFYRQKWNKFYGTKHEMAEMCLSRINEKRSRSKTW